MNQRGKLEELVLVESGPRADAVAGNVGEASAPWAREWEQIAAEHEAAKVYQLALWPETKRAMPTEFVRSALFAAIQGKDATHLDRVEIASANDLSIFYTGHRLTQVHADVWEGIMHLARGRPESTHVRFRSREFLRLIGRHTGKRQRDELRLWWAQLTATCVEVHDKKNRRRYFGSLLPRGAAKDEDDDSMYVVEINRDLARLFDRGFSTVDWEQRKRLLKKPLCLWLQHHFSAFPKPVTVSALHRLSGSTAQQIRQFRAKLKVALVELQNAGVLTAWRIEQDTVYATLPPKRPGNDATPELLEDSTPALTGARHAGASKAASKRSGVTPATVPLPCPEPVPVCTEPAPGRVGAAAVASFRRLYPDCDVNQCLNDWYGWSGSRKARNPDAAFLGFAKKWSTST